MNYYNTTKLIGLDLMDSQCQASRQDDLIFEVFKKNPGRLIAPHQVHELVMLNCPLTSVRRSMNTLTNEGRIYKSDVQVDGSFGKPVYTWGLML